MSFGSRSTGNKSSFLNYNELVEKDLKPGDLIEIDRGTYNHWAMFSNKSDNGSHWCFHVTTIDGDFEKKGALMSSARNVVAALKKHKLKDILDDNDSKQPSLARINNKIEEAKRKNYVPRPIEKVIESLEKQKDQQVGYNVTASNCEHYVTNWKYGKGWSRQVDVVKTSTITAAVATATLFVGALIFGIFKAVRTAKCEDDSDAE